MRANRWTIRPMAPADIPVAAALDRVCIPPGWAPQTFAEQLASTAGCFLVADAGGALLGYSGGTMILDEAHLSTLAVTPEHRREGLGAALLRAFLIAGRARGCRRFTLEVRESNLAARALYSRFGFQPVSRRRRYYADNDEDALVLWIEDAEDMGWGPPFTRVDPVS